MYIDCDSRNEYCRRSSEETLMQELDYACHVRMHAFIVPLTGLSKVNLTRILISKLVPTTVIEIWFKVPLVSYKQMTKRYRKKADSDAEPTEEYDTWNWWNMVRSLAKSNSRACLALELTEDFPGEVGDIEMLRWLGEPIRALVLPTHLFVMNAKGFPVLSRKQHLFLEAVARACPIGVNYIVTGACRHKSYDLYRRYIEFVVDRTRDEVDDKYPFYAKAYPDVLQYPFQPIADVMDSQTYEVFEKDPVKYNKYQEAIFQALKDRVSKEEHATKVQVVWVLGAGRGPLVSAALNAGLKAEVRVRVFAVEKNENCVLTLETRQIECWRGYDVTVIRGDMRDCRPKEADLADIVVSELLGSFGDDNLAPELLDGSHHIFKEDAISIPFSHSNSLCPIQSMKLHNSAQIRDPERVYVNPLETPHIGILKNFSIIDSPKQLFRFEHPNTQSELHEDNTRYKILEFNVKSKCILHGFAGYFQTLLYGDIALSTMPNNHTSGLFTWFPIYFPIQDPVELKAGDKVELHFWRLVNNEKMWYEWSICKPKFIPIHNLNGISFCAKLRSN